MSGDDLVLWNVVEEHLAEAEFLLDQWRAALRSPRLTLALVQRTLERRLAAHLDGLVVGGAPVADKLLWPVLAEKTKAKPPSIAAATLALLATLDGTVTQRVVDRFATSTNDAVLVGLRLAFPLTPGTDVDEALRLALYAVDAPMAQVALLEVLAARRVDPGPILGALLQSPNQDVVRAALGAAPLADARTHRYTIEPLLADGDPGIRAAALRAALIWNLSSGWRACLDEARAGAPLAMPFLALLGGPGELALLTGALQIAERRGPALFALGFHGRRGAVEACLPCLDDPDETIAKLAGEAIAAITGMPLFDQPFALAPAKPPEGDVGLPPLQIDLATDLMPKQTAVLPLPNAAAIRGWWSERRASFDANERYLRGKALSPAAIQDAVAQGPLWRVGPLLDEIAIRSGACLQLPELRLGFEPPAIPSDISLHRQPVWR